MPAHPHDANRVAIVGAASLRGKELKQVLEDRNFPAREIILLDEGELAGTLTEAAGEPTFIRALGPDSFEGARFVFFAGSEPDATRNMEAARKSGATVVDLTGAAARSGHGIARIPSLAPLLSSSFGANGSAPGQSFFSPSAPGIISCTLAAGLAKLSAERVAILLFPSVSERDQAGIDELESQTASLLSFHDIAKPVFDAQVAFNLLSSYGELSKVQLDDMRSAVVREVGQYLGNRVPMPAIQLLQAPVFYGYAFQVYTEFRSPLPAEITAEKIGQTFVQLGVKMPLTGDPSPTNVTIAGENEIYFAGIKGDSSVPSGFWISGVADNLRLAATNAVRIAEELLATGPRV